MGSVGRTVRTQAGSFKFRLVAYFLLLALLPLLGALWAFSEVAGESETGRADARLNAALRVAVAEYGDQLAEAEETAASLAAATRVQDALVARNRAALVRLTREVANVSFYAGGERLAGSRVGLAAGRRAATVRGADGKALGRVEVTIPAERELVEHLRTRIGLMPYDRLLLVSGETVVAGPRDLAGEIRLPRERPANVTLAGTRFRALGTPISSEAPGLVLVALAPRSEIEAGTTALRRRLLAFAALALLVAGCLAYVLGRTIVASLRELVTAAGELAAGRFESRVPVRGRDEFATLGHAFNDMAAQLESRIEELAWERGRARDAIARFGEALAATHNPYLLLPVILESIVEMTGAAGGRLIVAGEPEARAGDPDHGPEPLAIPLRAEDDELGILFLTPREREFAQEARELAHWLASQATTALENASLHRRLEREAVTDGLTELPNRRQFEESLEAELSRVERFGGTLSLIVADLDDFKQVNDRYGHLAGDEALRTFAAVLRENVRAIDTASRYGGEEFAVLLPETDLEGAERVAERIRLAMETRPVETFPGAAATVTASFGVAAYPDQPTEEALFAAADEALYRAKAGGKNRVEAAKTAETVRPDP